MDRPHECHLTSIKRVLRYIKGMIDHGVLMPRQTKTKYMTTLIQISVEIMTKIRVIHDTYS